MKNVKILQFFLKIYLCSMYCCYKSHQANPDWVTFMQQNVHFISHIPDTGWYFEHKGKKLLWHKCIGNDNNLIHTKQYNMYICSKWKNIAPFTPFFCLFLCLKQNCSSQKRSRRSVSQMEEKRKQAAVVSAGPLTVNMGVKSVHPSHCEFIWELLQINNFRQTAQITNNY